MKEKQKLNSHNFFSFKKMPSHIRMLFRPTSFHAWWFGYHQLYFSEWTHSSDAINFLRDWERCGTVPYKKMLSPWRKYEFHFRGTLPADSSFPSRGISLDKTISDYFRKRVSADLSLWKKLSVPLSFFIFYRWFSLISLNQIRKSWSLKFPILKIENRTPSLHSRDFPSIQLTEKILKVNFFPFQSVRQTLSNFSRIRTPPVTEQRRSVSITLQQRVLFRGRYWSCEQRSPHENIGELFSMEPNEFLYVLYMGFRINA